MRQIPEQNGWMMNVEVREVPEQLVVAEERVVNQAEPLEWLPGAMSRVAAGPGHRRRIAVTCSCTESTRCSSSAHAPVIGPTRRGWPVHEGCWGTKPTPPRLANCWLVVVAVDNLS